LIFVQNINDYFYLCGCYKRKTEKICGNNKSVIFLAHWAILLIILIKIVSEIIVSY